MLGMFKRIRNFFRMKMTVNLAKKDINLISEFQSLSNEHKFKLLNLREYFWQDKMGRFIERAGLFYITSRLNNPKTIVEIGSWVGVSTCYIAAGLASNSKAQIFGVDTFKGSTINETASIAWNKSVNNMGGTTLNRFIENITSAGFEKKISPIVSESYDAAKKWNDKIDFLFIDGDHFYDSVKKDFDAWFPHLTSRGVLAFHDYDEKHPEVVRFVNEVKDSHLSKFKIKQFESIICFYPESIDI
jgi:predicted O-methyltransferase YrrM